MPEYRVDQMNGETVLSSTTTIAATPVKAAEKASGREITFSPDKGRRWVRVQEGDPAALRRRLLRCRRGAWAMKIIIERCVIKPPGRPWIEWVASYEGFDDTGDDGLGATKAVAVADLFERYPEPAAGDKSESHH